MKDGIGEWYFSPLYVTAFLGASQIKRALVDTHASTNILPLPTLDAVGIL